MPPKKNQKAHLNEICKRFPAFTIDNNDLFCRYCKILIKYHPRSVAGQASSHVKAAYHIQNESSNRKKFCFLEPFYAINDLFLETQEPIANAFQQASKKEASRGEFHKDLAKWLISANIPFHVLQNESTKEFIEKYTQFKCPDESTVRKNYLQPLYDDTMDAVRKKIGDNSIYIIADETTDALGRYVINVMAGVLDGNPTKSMLISTVELPNGTSEVIAQAINDAISLIYPGENSAKYERVILFLSDQASAMVKAGKILKPMYTKMKHVTCLAHALNVVAQEIKKCNGFANQLIANMKTIFSKCTRRKVLYTSVTKLLLPPKVVTVRWGTWLDCAYYFNDNLDLVLDFIENHLDDEDSEACENLQKLVSNHTAELKEQLLEISKYKYLSEAIVFFQKENLSSRQQINKIIEIKDKLKVDDVRYHKKLNESLKKNPDIIDFNEITQPQELLNKQKYAPLTSVDVERSFSDFKMILKPQRLSFAMQNLALYTVIHYNAFLLRT